MLRPLILILKIAGVLLFALVCYSVYVVVDATNRTPAIIDAVMTSGRVTVMLGDFPEGWIDALLAVEDPGFYEHHGIDFKTPGTGSTTITQDLTRCLYFDDYTPGFDKLREMLIAFFVVDRKVPKDTQLLIFVNVCDLGRQEGSPVTGFGEAAHVYFDKEFEDLSFDEYLSLVAMLIAPGTYHVLDFEELNSDRVERIRRVLDGSYVPSGLNDVYYDDGDR